METNLALISPKPVLGLSISPNPRTLSTKHTFNLPLLPRKPAKSVQSSKPRSRTVLFAFSNPNSGRKLAHNDDCNGRKRINGVSVFASTSSSGQETTSVGVNPQLYTSPPPSQIGSPLFWIGVGVGLSALFSFVASRVKKYAMQQAFQAMMGQMSSQNSQFSNTTFSPGSPFGFPPPSTSGAINSSGFPFQPPSTSTGSASTSGPVQAMPPSNAASQATVDVSATKSEAPEPVDVKVEAELKTEVRKTEDRKSAFVDVSPDETLEKSPFEDVVDSSSENGAASKGAIPTQEGTASDWSQSTPGKSGSALSVEALEKMMEDPMVQKMIYPHLPEEMRNPATFKWMLQNPEYRQQLQDMLEKMGGSGEWDNRMMDTLKNFDFNSPDVQQQFDQLGLTPEEVISKIMANPDVAMAFQNPRVQQAIMDCSQNPMNIAKYQDDKEVMDVFNKISQLFPGTGGF